MPLWLQLLLGIPILILAAVLIVWDWRKKKELEESQKQLRESSRAFIASDKAYRAEVKKLIASLELRAYTPLFATRIHRESFRHSATMQITGHLAVGGVYDPPDPAEDDYLDPIIGVQVVSDGPGWRTNEDDTLGGEYEMVSIGNSAP